MRRRLALTAAAVTAMVVISFVVPLGALLRASAADQAENTAEVQSRSLGTVLTTVSDAPTLEQIVAEANATGPRSVSVVLADGRVVGHATEIDADIRRARQGEAFTRSERGARAVYLPVRRPDGTTSVVRVFVPRSIVEHGVLQAWLVLGGLGVALVVLAVVVTDRLARPMVAAMERLSDVTHRLRRGELDARVVPDGPPEIAEVGTAVNLLADQINEQLRAEREAAADVSHRLRTPMTALRLSVENLPGSTEAERVAGDLDHLELSVDGVIRELRRPVEAEAASSDLTAAVASRAAFWEVLAEAQHREMTLDLPAVPAVVAVGPTDLDATIDALLNNVFTHTDPGVPLAVQVEPGEGSAWRLSVDDGGPGLPDRVEPAPVTQGSTGLGLDIARRAAERSGGWLRTGRGPLGGVRVELELGAPDGR